MYASGPYHIDAFDRTTVSSCPKVAHVRVCEPAWRTSLGANEADPVAVGDLLYTANGSVNAFDSHGQRRCSGKPVPTCYPIWIGSIGTTTVCRTAP